MSGGNMERLNDARITFLKTHDVRNDAIFYKLLVQIDFNHSKFYYTCIMETIMLYFEGGSKNLRTNKFYIILGCETKPPILEWDKTADFENGTKSPILTMRQNSRF